LGKIRLDILLHQQGAASSREKARGLILAGQVMVQGRIIDKPGTLVSSSEEIEVRGRTHNYVSRGGVKMEKAARDFAVDFQNKTVMDIGASTGGYTDYALQNGAAIVYAVDVGYGQLDWKLRNDARVVNLERTNIRYLDLSLIPELIDIVMIDVSFISTVKVFPVVRQVVKENGLVVCLVKPQFEAGRELVGKKGVVKDRRVHAQVLEKCIREAEKQGLYCADITFSPITGPQGNIEFFILLKTTPCKGREIETYIANTVAAAHNTLGGKSRDEDPAAE